MSPMTQRDLFGNLALAGRVTYKPVTSRDVDIKIIEVSAAQMPNSFPLASEPAAKTEPAAKAAPATKTARSKAKRAARSF